MTGYIKYPNKITYSSDLQRWAVNHVPILKRNKFFNYFYIISEDYFMTMANVDLGLMRASYVNVRDLKTGVVDEITVEDFLGQYVHIDASKFTTEMYSSCNHPDLTSSIFKHRDSPWVNLDISGYFDGHFKADMETDNEGMTMLCPITADWTRYNLNTKVPGIGIYDGELKKDGKTLFKCTQEKPCIGLNDQGRHIVPYAEGGWFWSSFSAWQSGHRVAMNAGYGNDDSSIGATDDSIYVDGKLYKLDPTVVEKVSEKKWTFKSFRGDKSLVKFPKNAMDLIFTIDNDHTMNKDFVLVKLNFKSIYGRVSGTFTYEGKTLKITDKFMFVEEMTALW